MFGAILPKREFRTPKNIVFSPHVDDEVIGCFTALNDNLITDVVYFFDITVERELEAKRSAGMFGFKPWFCKVHYNNYAEIPLEIHDIRKDDTIFVPTSKDNHPQHKLVNRIAREYQMRTKCRLIFYTVDMESFQVPLKPEIRDAKKKALETLYPSQSVLLSNEKYHLFEGYADSEYARSRRYEFGDIEVVMTGAYVPEKINGPEDNEQDESYLNRLIVSHYHNGMVTGIVVRRGDTQVEFNG